MRVTIIAFYLACVSLTALASGQDGGFCVIPKLVPGVPAQVSLEYIDKPFCGVALIDGHYQKLADITVRQEESDVTCTSSSSCRKTVHYFSRNEAQKDPYVIIFSGPKSQAGA